MGNHPIQDAAFEWIGPAILFARRRWKTVAGTTVVTVGLALGYLMVATPRYTASTNLVIDTRQGNPFQSQPVAVDSLGDNAVVESQVEVLRSTGIALRVVELLHLDADPRFQTLNGGIKEKLLAPVMFVLDQFSRKTPGVGTNGAETAQQIQESRSAQLVSAMLAVRRVGQSYMVDVSATTPWPDMSASIANAVVKAYTAAQLASKVDTSRRASGWLEDRIRELREQAIAADRAVQEYKVRNNIVDTDRGLMTEQQLSDLNTQLTQVRAHVAQAQARYDRIQAILKTPGADPGDMTDLLQNQVVIQLRQQYLEAARKEAEWAQRYGANHIAAVNLRGDMARLQQAMRSELARLAETYRSDLAVSKDNQAGLEKQLTEAVQQAATTNADRIMLRALQSSADTYRTNYENFLQRYTQAVQDQSFPITDARVVTPATAPLSPSKPNKLLVLLGSIVVGAGLGSGIALLRELVDRGFRTPAQIKLATGLDCLGMLPRMTRRELAGGRGARQGAAADPVVRTVSTRAPALRHVVLHPLSQFSEVVRDLRVYIARPRRRTRPIKVIGIISVTPGEGKSTIASNLAQVFAQSGRRTALLDCDMRRATLTHALTPGDQPGFFEVVANKVTLGDALWHDPQTGLNFLPASSLQAPDTAGLLYSERASRVMEELRDTQDCVVVDLPALAPVIDAHAVSHLIDAFILVAEWGRVDQAVVKENLARLGLDEGGLIGVVLNKVDLVGMRRYAGAASVISDGYGYRSKVSA